MKLSRRFTPKSLLPALVAALLFAAVPTPASARCGDGDVDAAEECDPGADIDGDCCSSACMFEPSNSECDTDDACYSTGICDDGECVGDIPIPCDDGNPCTTDYCNPEAGGCQANAVAGCCTVDAECNDTTVCNGFETCSIAPTATTGTCVPGTPIPCDDGDACTVDTCDPAEGGCQFEPYSLASGCIADDVDADGIWDRFDKCIDTPPGVTPDLAGCSSGDIAENPMLLVTEADKAFDKISQTWFFDDEFKRERSFVRKIRRAMEKGALLFGTGRSCIAAKSFFKAEKTVEKIYYSLDRRRRSAFLLAARKPTSPSAAAPGDHRPEEAEAAYHELASLVVGRAAAPMVLSSQAVHQTCQAAVPVKLERAVAQVQPLLGRLVLDDGTLVRLRGASLLGSPVVGSTVRISGERVGLLDVIAGGIVVTRIPKLELAPYDITQCYKLRVAPVQPAEDLASAPELHTFPGYRFQGETSAARLYLEQGQAIYIEQVCTPPGTTPDVDGKYLRYYAEFNAKAKTFLSSSWSFAGRLDVSAGEWFLLPTSLAGQGDLTVKWYTRECDADLANPCGGVSNPTVKLIRTEVLPISVAATGGYCMAEYEETEFELPDRDPDWDDPDSITFGSLFDDFKPARAIGTSGLAAVMGGTRSFRAMAYRVTGPTTSTFPDLEEVQENEDFAIYPTRDPFLATSDPTGVDHAAGVAWPSVVGTRNSASYRYACRVPDIVRDVVDFCADFPASYYRLPYYPDLGNVGCGQGNNTQFTHCGEGYPYKCGQKYAFDFSVPDGKPIYAARGGIVIGVRDDAKNSCSSKTACTEDQFFCCVESAGGGICTQGASFKIGNVCHANSECDSNAISADGVCRCAANIVSIEHSDGSVGQYFHMEEGGVDVAEGDRVFRGDRIGFTGNTGCSTHPHLHFHVIGTAGKGDAWQKATKLVRFDHATGTCVTPASKSAYKSKNGQWIGAD